MIRSTFAGFTTAQLAMSASQRALDVTGQNIANINTRGYSKQRLEISSLNNNGASFYSSKMTQKSDMVSKLPGSPSSEIRFWTFSTATR